MRTFDFGPSPGVAVAADKRSASAATAPANKTPEAVDLRKHLRETFVSIFILLLLMTRVQVDHYDIPRRDSPAPGSPSNHPSEKLSAPNANPKIAHSSMPAEYGCAPSRRPGTQGPRAG